MASKHWADQLAEQIVERAAREKRTPNVKCQQTPSGGKHIGNLNDVVRAWFPVKAVRERGVKCEFVHTTDDRDPVKDVPARIADRDGRWHSIKEFPDVEKYLGHPLCRTPDPFGCCKSWSEHFTAVWMDGVYALGMDPVLHSVNQLYEQGKFDPWVETVFRKRTEAGQICAEFQRTKRPDYIPFDAICPSCGILTNVTEVDLANRTVSFTCGGKAIKKRTAEGCGQRGTVPWREGKLQWRFEWPALWCLFQTTFEPFGKDHAEGSWPAGQAIMKRVYGREPPIPFVYEFFLVNGEKMSASKGNVYIVQDLMKVMEPEPFLYFYTKRPEKQRDLDLAHLPRMVDEFDEAERVYFGKSEERTELREENTKRMYQLTMEMLPAKPPVRPDYSFCAALIQALGEEEALRKLQALGHLEGATKEDLAAAKLRLRLARNWVELFAADEFRFKLTHDDQSLRDWKALQPAQQAALQDFSVVVEAGKHEAELHEHARQLAQRHGLPLKAFFEAAYLVLLGKPRGPRLMAFVSALDREEVARRFRGRPK